MRVAQVWRYPVKSMSGESLDHVDLDPDGVPGDRCWAVRDSESGTVLNARVVHALLHARGAIVADRAQITFPDGRTFDEDDANLDLALSSWLRRPVHLARAKPDEVATIEAPAEITGGGALVRWRSKPGSFNDGHPVHVLTTASLRAAGPLHPGGQWDARRFRANVVVDVGPDEVAGDEFVEDAWSSIRVGDVELAVYKHTVRCALTSRAQPDGLVDDIEVPRALARNRKARLGVYARVTVPGTVTVGADVRVS